MRHPLDNRLNMGECSTDNAACQLYLTGSRYCNLLRFGMDRLRGEPAAYSGEGDQDFGACRSAGTGQVRAGCATQCFATACGATGFVASGSQTAGAPLARTPRPRLTDLRDGLPRDLGHRLATGGAVCGADVKQASATRGRCRGRSRWWRRWSWRQRAAGARRATAACPRDGGGWSARREVPARRRPRGGPDLRRIDALRLAAGRVVAGCVHDRSGRSGVATVMRRCTMWTTLLKSHHRQTEIPYITIRRSQQGRLLVVAHAEPMGRLRIISARQVTRREEQLYAEPEWPR
jgi:uncharacterized DUF497 family protein